MKKEAMASSQTDLKLILSLRARDTAHLLVQVQNGQRITDTGRNHINRTGTQSPNSARVYCFPLQCMTSETKRNSSIPNQSLGHSLPYWQSRPEH